MAKKFELLAWAHSIPLCDDLWLSKHAQNVAMVDQTIIRDIEKRVVEEYFKEDHVPMDLFMPLAALSQCGSFIV